MPYREALLTFRAKRISYERIATILKGHRVTIAASTIGYFCRRHCPEADIERVRRSLVVAAIGTGNVTPPPVPASPSASPPPSADPGKRRNPRIARDDL
jgi:hypothetical protein